MWFHPFYSTISPSDYHLSVLSAYITSTDFVFVVQSDNTVLYTTLTGTGPSPLSQTSVSKPTNYVHIISCSIYCVIITHDFT